MENIRSHVAEMKAAKPQMEQQIKDAEDLLDRTADPNAHADLESRIRAGKANLARVDQEDASKKALSESVKLSPSRNGTSIPWVVIQTIIDCEV